MKLELVGVEDDLGGWADNLQLDLDCALVGEATTNLEIIEREGVVGRAGTEGKKGGKSVGWFKWDRKGEKSRKMTRTSPAGDHGPKQP